MSKKKQNKPAKLPQKMAGLSKEKVNLAEFGEITDLPPPPLVDWSSGPGAQMEFVGPSPFNRNYTLPWRPALRQPMEDFTLTGAPYDELCEKLKKLKTLLNQGDSKQHESRVISTPQLIDEVMKIRGTTDSDLVALGQALRRTFFPAKMANALRQYGKNPVFIEIGVDEKLNEFPFELIRVDDEYLCLKHNVGRYVVANIQEEPPRPDFTLKKKRSVLLVSVPAPKPRNAPPGALISPLKLVEEEAEQIESLLKEIPEETIAYKHLRNASWDDFTRVINDAQQERRSYDIIHFCGHGYFDEKTPANSALVFQNELMTGPGLLPAFQDVRPLFCFINACQSIAAADETERFNLYGLGKTFLQTGAYLLGSRSLIDDTAARVFAKEFYTNLLGKNKPLGESVRLARVACKGAVKDSFDWASYIFYGDPRVNFPKGSPP